MERFSPIIGILFFILMVGLFLLTAAAYFEGAEVWFGWSGWFSILIFVVACSLQGIGGLFLTVVAFYGMWKGWEWPLWIALLVAFPSIGIMIASIIGGGIVTLARSLLRRRPNSELQ